jgi:hypothetical protein
MENIYSVIFRFCHTFLRFCRATMTRQFFLKKCMENICSVIFYILLDIFEILSYYIDSAIFLL